jgi:peptidoglycan/LPS O-acetylase OafA/YrhL
VTEDQRTAPILRRKMPELDSLRGIAILTVVFYHGFAQYDTSGFPAIERAFLIATQWGWLGVNLFFVLSGFLITGILLDSKKNVDYYGPFYIRRALRILPAYSLLLILLLVLSKFGFVNRHVSWSFVGLSFVYLANFTNFFGVPMQYGPLWSLSVEEHFYLLWPALVRNLSRKWIAICALGVIIVIPALRAYMFWRGHTAEAWYTPLVADGLAFGALLAILARTRLAARDKMLHITAALLSASILALGLGIFYGLFKQESLIGAALRRTLFSAMFTGALSGALLVGSSSWARLVQRPFLQFYGEISYGLYLIHTLVFDLADSFAARFVPSLGRLAVQGHFGMMWLRFLIASGFATLAAFFSRRYFEERFLRLKDRWAKERPNVIEVKAEIPSAESTARVAS